MLPCEGASEHPTTPQRLTHIKSTMHQRNRIIYFLKLFSLPCSMRAMLERWRTTINTAKTLPRVNRGSPTPYNTYALTARLTANNIEAIATKRVL